MLQGTQPWFPRVYRGIDCCCRYRYCEYNSLVAIKQVTDLRRCPRQAYWLDFGLSFVDSSVSWRFPTAFQIVFAVILIVGVIWLPESPHWLLAHAEERPEYEARALRICAALNGVGVADPATIQQKDLILDGINARRRAQVAGSKEILSGGKKQHLRRALVGASTQVFQQLGGCNAVIYYSTILFENQIGLETQLALILGGVLSTVYAISALFSFVLVER